LFGSVEFVCFSVGEERSVEQWEDAGEAWNNVWVRGGGEEARFFVRWVHRVVRLSMSEF